MSAEAVIELPYNFTLRHYQQAIWNAIFLDKKQYIVVIAHRRSGKDLLLVNIMSALSQVRVGGYYHVFPTTALAKEVIWEGSTDGYQNENGVWVGARRFIDHFHPALIDGKPRESDLSIRFKNGSRWSLRGATDKNRSIGTNPVCVGLSEFSIMQADIEPFYLPIIINNGGIMIYIYTPRGHNHGFDLMQTALKNPTTYALFVQPVDYTKAMTKKQLEAAKLRSTREEYLQEYFCDFNAGLHGSYYGEHMERAKEQKRVGHYPYNPEYPVNTAWDLGHSDATAIVFFQHYDNKIFIIDYYEADGEDFSHYAKIIKEKPYTNYGKHFAPHDMAQREWFAGNSRLGIASEEHGIDFVVLEKWAFQDGVDAVRRILPRMFFNYEATLYADSNRKDNVGRLVRALSEYKKSWDAKAQCFSDNPVKDWSSHPADALRYVAMAFPDEERKTQGKSASAVSHMELGWNPHLPLGEASVENQVRSYESEGNENMDGFLDLDFEF